MLFSTFIACLVMAPLALAIPAELPSAEGALALRAAENIEIPKDLPDDWKTALEAYFKGIVVFRLE
ncbi:hypothetical protein COL5a_000228 [Colletotrichum fioriniae]|uniref:uncharacterized protein n=1 Tax=Colletotrichum fioriniae TaxID=710243 RepID=UPI0032DB6EE3|nr:hypothetical protein COL5a_000228 [Colletotrichum fioriniae]KAJ3946830.1 hypothetical protein N0V96_003206 [Colletotrichum fioriniae]